MPLEIDIARNILHMLNMGYIFLSNIVFWHGFDVWLRNLIDVCPRAKRKIRTGCFRRRIKRARSATGCGGAFAMRALFNL
jgi:hypothetical protein